MPSFLMNEIPIVAKSTFCTCNFIWKPMIVDRLIFLFIFYFSHDPRQCFFLCLFHLIYVAWTINFGANVKLFFLFSQLMRNYKRKIVDCQWLLSSGKLRRRRRRKNKLINTRSHNSNVSLKCLWQTFSIFLVLLSVSLSISLRLKVFFVGHFLHPSHHRF